MRNFALTTMIIYFILSFTSLKGQDFPKSVCGLDKISDSYFLKTNNTPLEEGSELLAYLDDIKKLYNQPFARYNLRKITNREIAAAHLQRINKNDAARVITINDEYYSSKTNSPLQKKAILIWILAHEMQHHINGDLHYDQKVVADNLKKEILADERAGFAVGKLTDVDYSFFEQSLPIFLHPNHESSTHPPLQYRIFAAQVGWIRAKLEDTNQVIIDSTEYKKIKYNNGTTTWGQSFGNQINGIGLELYASQNLYIGEIYENSRKGIGTYINYNDQHQSYSIFFGEWDSSRNGKGTKFWANGDSYYGDWVANERIGFGTYIWANGSTYTGGWKENKRTGKGTYYYSNGDIYRGFWENNQKHGDGILYNGDKLINAGCWKNDVYQGFSCD